MEQRISARDLLYFGGLAILFIFLILVMYMIDRQWEKMSQMEQVMREQAADVQGLRTQIGDLSAQLAQWLARPVSKVLLIMVFHRPFSVPGRPHSSLIMPRVTGR